MAEERSTEGDSATDVVSGFEICVAVKGGCCADDVAVVVLGVKRREEDVWKKGWVDGVTGDPAGGRGALNLNMPP